MVSTCADELAARLYIWSPGNGFPWIGASRPLPYPSRVAAVGSFYSERVDASPGYAVPMRREVGFGINTNIGVLYPMEHIIYVFETGVARQIATVIDLVIKERGLK